MARAACRRILLHMIPTEKAMADINIQFHALPEELRRFAEQCVHDFDLHVVAMKYFPFEANEVPQDSLSSVFSTTALFRELAFTLERPVLPVVSNLDFYDKNSNKLRLDIQRPTKDGLRQTWLACRTNDTTALSVWKQIAKRLKKITKAGVIVVNPNSGCSAPCSSFRYTAGAKALECEGVRMLPAAGGNIIKFPSD